MATRIYAVQAPNSFHLVEAGSKHSALRHVAKNLVDVEVASQKTLVAAMKDGIKIEVAGAEEPEAATAE
jgi:hypothetical protein